MMEHLPDNDEYFDVPSVAVLITVALVICAVIVGLAHIIGSRVGVP